MGDGNEERQSRPDEVGVLIEIKPVGQLQQGPVRELDAHVVEAASERGLGQVAGLTGVTADDRVGPDGDTPLGVSRLRLTARADLTDADLDRVREVLTEVRREVLG